MEHLSPTQAMVVAMYGPSGLLKIVAPQVEKTMFPRLPDWFWLPCGLWEVFGMMALVFWDMSALGLFMLYTFMGGVLFSILQLEDLQGHTLISGKGKVLGDRGRGAIFPCLIGIELLWSLDDTLHDDTCLLIPVLPMLFGWVFGAYLQRQSRQKDSVHPEKRYF